MELPFIGRGGVTGNNCRSSLFVLLVGECDINSSALGVLSLKHLLDIQVERSNWPHRPGI